MHHVQVCHGKTLTRTVHCSRTFFTSPTIRHKDQGSKDGNSDLEVVGSCSVSTTSTTSTTASSPVTTTTTMTAPLGSIDSTMGDPGDDARVGHCFFYHACFSSQLLGCIWNLWGGIANYASCVQNTRLFGNKINCFIATEPVLGSAGILKLFYLRACWLLQLEIN